MIDLTNNFGVILKGGSIGSSNTNYIPSKNGRLIMTFLTMDMAKDYAKLMRNKLSPGEKSYYKMKYLSIQLTPYIKKQIRNNGKSLCRENVCKWHINIIR